MIAARHPGPRRSARHGIIEAAGNLHPVTDSANVGGTIASRDGGTGEGSVTCQKAISKTNIVVRQAYLDRLGLRGAELLVYALIAGVPGTVELSQGYIAYRCGISARRAKDVLDSLEARGLIACVRRGGPDGAGRWRALG